MMIVTVMEMVSVEMVGGRNKSVEIITRDDRRGIPTSLGGLPVYLEGYRYFQTTPGSRLEPQCTSRGSALCYIYLLRLYIGGLLIHAKHTRKQINSATVYK